MRPIIVVLGSLVVAGAAASGCAFAREPATPMVSKTTLQDDIADIVREAGVEPKSITCPNDLLGEVGQRTQCEVETVDTDALLAPIVTVTEVNGSDVKWHYDPAYSQSQLERVVAEIVERDSGAAPGSVSCDSGLEGKKGSVTHCDVGVGDVTMRRTAMIARVQNLWTRVVLLPALSRVDVEKSLIDMLTPQIGQPPDSVKCSDDLQGVVGITVECTVVAGPETQDFVLTATSVSGDRIDYDFEPKD
jgi:hypothetical protein